MGKRVTVTVDDLDTVQDQGSVVAVTGTCLDRRITFAGDHRPMDQFLAAVEEHGEAYAEVEPWQIIGVGRVVA